VTFVACVPEQAHAGTCAGATTCDIAAPRCPVGTTPGIANGCYTGVCIPTTYCAPLGV
jgi:hypothetical protein